MLLFLRHCTIILIIITTSTAQQSDTFKPIINCEEEDCLHATLTFSYKSNSYKYNLIRNDDLFDYRYEKDSKANPYYIDDKGDPFTAVRIGKSNEGIRGVIKVEEELKAIAFNNATGLHYFKPQIDESRLSKGPLDEVLEAPKGYQLEALGGLEEKRFDGSVPFPVKLTMTIDKTALRKWFNNDEKKVKELAESLTNAAARFFKEVNVKLTLLEFFVLDANIGTTIVGLSKHIVEYNDAVKSLPKSAEHHLYHGLTGSYDPNTAAVGVAYHEGVCIPNLNVGVSTVTYDQKKLGSETEMALVMTHEIGHNLFLLHDPKPDELDSNCVCDDPSKECIMFYRKSSATTWSSCSRENLTRLATHIGSDPSNCPHIHPFPHRTRGNTRTPTRTPTDSSSIASGVIIVIAVIILLSIIAVGVFTYYKMSKDSKRQASQPMGFINPTYQSPANQSFYPAPGYASPIFAPQSTPFVNPVYQQSSHSPAFWNNQYGSPQQNLSSANNIGVQKTASAQMPMALNSPQNFQAQSSHFVGYANPYYAPQPTGYGNRVYQKYISSQPIINTVSNQYENPQQNPTNAFAVGAQQSQQNAFVNPAYQSTFNPVTNQYAYPADDVANPMPMATNIAQNFQAQQHSPSDNPSYEPQTASVAITMSNQSQSLPQNATLLEQPGVTTQQPADVDPKNDSRSDKV